MECRLGYYFAREIGTDKITTVACWGDKIDKDTDKDIEIVERIPQSVVSYCNKGVKILNLNRILKQKGR